MQYRVTSILELKEQKKRQIYCFGAGKAFDSFMVEFAQYKLEKHVKAVVDNNAGCMKIVAKTVNNVCIPVISMKQMLIDIKANDCILITTAGYEEVIKQLEKIEQLDAITYYIYTFMRIAQYDYDRWNVKIPSKRSLYRKKQIPKTIHYCWFGRNEIPAQYQKWMESWKRYCPDYEIIEWNENNYDVNKNQYTRQAYKRKKWAFVSDYARIDIVNEYGGIYLDTDVEIVASFDELLYQKGFAGFESEQFVALGLGFGAVKGLPIIKEMMDYYDNQEFVNEDGSLNLIASPRLQTGILMEHGLQANGEYQIIDGMTIFPEKMFCGKSVLSRMIMLKPYTRSIHYFDASWQDENSKGKIRNRQIEKML